MDENRKHRLYVAHLSRESWKARHRNGGWWRERWITCNRKGCKWRLVLRWEVLKPPTPRRPWCSRMRSNPSPSKRAAAVSYLRDTPS